MYPLQSIQLLDSLYQAIRFNEGKGLPMPSWSQVSSIVHLALTELKIVAAERDGYIKHISRDDKRFCYDGYQCGCMGATVAEEIIHSVKGDAAKSVALTSK